MFTSTSKPGVYGIVAMFLLAAAGHSSAGITRFDLGMTASASSCTVACTLDSSYTRAADAADAQSGDWSAIAVNAAVEASSSALAVSATGTAAPSGDTFLGTRLIVQRPVTLATTGSYDARASTVFSFVTDTDGGTMNVGYSVDYARVLPGTSMNTGIRFNARRFAAQTVPPLDTASLFGTSFGSWTYTLAPDTIYIVTLDAAIGIAFAGPGGLPLEYLDSTFNISLPGLTAPVPEPTQMVLLLAGLLMLGLRLRGWLQSG